MGTTVITCAYFSPILESAKHDFYLVPLFIKLLIMRDRLFPVASARNTWRYPFVEQCIAKPVRIISSIH